MTGGSERGRRCSIDSCPPSRSILTMYAHGRFMDDANYFAFAPPRARVEPFTCAVPMSFNWVLPFPFRFYNVVIVSANQ